MREALDNADRSDGMDDVIGQTSSLCVSDDYKEVKGRAALVPFLSHHSRGDRHQSEQWRLLSAMFQFGA